ncbi:hypothetical protein D3C71_539570 [compost metagenome]
MQTTENFMNFQLPGKDYTIHRLNSCDQKTVWENLFQILILINLGVVFRKETLGSIRFMCHTFRRNWLSSSERIYSISAWTVYLQYHKRTFLAVEPTSMPSPELKAYIIMEISPTYISPGCFIFQEDLTSVKNGYGLSQTNFMVPILYTVMAMDRMKIKANWALGTYCQVSACSM